MHGAFLFFFFFYSHRENKRARSKERGRKRSECLYHNFMLYGFLQNHSHKLCRVTTGYRPAVILTPLTYTGRDRRDISPQPGTIEMGGDLSRFPPAPSNGSMKTKFASSPRTAKSSSLKRRTYGGGSLSLFLSLALSSSISVFQLKLFKPSDVSIGERSRMVIRKYPRNSRLTSFHACS